MRTPESGLRTDMPAAWDVLDLLPVGLAQLAVDGRVVRVNVQLGELLGINDRFMPELRFDDLPLDGAHPPGQGHVRRLRRPDGSEVCARVSVLPIATDSPDAAFLATVVDVTEERRSNEAIRAECDRYHAVVDNLADLVLVRRGKEITWASPSAHTVLGLDARDLVGRSLDEFSVIEDLERLIPPPRPREVATHRLRLRTAGGDLRWFQAHVTAPRVPGEMPVTYASLRDIDDQVRVEDALAESERWLRRAFEASPDAWAIMVADRGVDGEVTGIRYAQVNQAGLRDLRCSEEEIIGREVGEVAELAGSADLLRDLCLQALRTDERIPNRLDLEVRGQRRVTEGFMVSLDRNTLLNSWRDVTEIVQSQELLARAYEETAEMRVTLQTALDATSDGFAVYSLDWDLETGELTGMRVVHANAAGADSLGLVADEMIGRELREIFPKVDSTGLWDRIVLAATTKEPQQLRIHIHHDDGRWKSAWDNTVAPVGEERMAITWRDASKEERAIRQLARTRDEAMYSATHDALTDLPNRVLLLQHLQEALKNCAPEERIGLVFVDLDRFKEINDTYGHAAGDVVLKETAVRLGRMVRHGDLAARLAGDEFILVLTALTPDWSPEQFFARASVLLSEPVWWEGVELSPSASLGAVLSNPCSEHVDVDELIKRADAEMYQAKAARRRTPPQA